MYVCVRVLDPGVVDSCDLPCGCWKLNPDPLEEQTTEPSLQPKHFFRRSSITRIHPIEEIKEECKNTLKSSLGPKELGRERSRDKVERCFRRRPARDWTSGFCQSN